MENETANDILTDIVNSIYDYNLTGDESVKYTGEDIIRIVEDNMDQVLSEINYTISAQDRQEVIDYVSRKYGADHVSQIITFGTMSARMVIRDVGRVLDVPYAVADKLAKMIPNEIHITIKKALEQNKELNDE